ncbi:MAG: superoxide dismutase [Salinivirgaceae bacterium]
MKTLLSFLLLAFGGVAAFAQFTQPALPYTYNALEPYIDAATMEIHYGKHHKAYIDNLNKAVAGTEYEKKTIDQLIASITENTPVTIRNNGGGVWNHTFFWNCMAPNAGGNPTGTLAGAINAQWGDMVKFKDAFKKAALGQFGSGWAWLVVADKKLAIVSTPNQDNPLMPVSSVKEIPILTLDVWEHAYYLKYQNKRGDYVDQFWNVVDWKTVEKRYEEALK